MRRAFAVLGAMGPVVIKDIEDKTGLSMRKWWEKTRKLEAAIHSFFGDEGGRACLRLGFLWPKNLSFAIRTLCAFLG